MHTKLYQLGTMVMLPLVLGGIPSNGFHPTHGAGTPCAVNASTALKHGTRAHQHSTCNECQSVLVATVFAHHVPIHDAMDGAIVVLGVRSGPRPGAQRPKLQTRVYTHRERRLVVASKPFEIRDNL